MRLNNSILVLALLALVPALAAAEAGTWTVDTAHSEVAFSVRHFFTPVPGHFDEFEGVIVYDPDSVGNSSVEFTVQAVSIDTNNSDRDDHLRSPDFFDVAKYPTLSFTSTGVSGGGSNLQVTGDLTLHGVTKTVTIPVEFLGSMATPMGTKAGFSTEFKIDRKDYGINWNRILDQGGAVLGDEVTVRINVEADKLEEATEGEAR